MNGAVIGQRDGFGDVACILGEQPDTIAAIQIDGTVVGDVAGIAVRTIPCLPDWLMLMITVA